MGLSYFISFHARFAPGLAPQKPLQSFTHKGFTRKSFQTNKPLHRAAFAHKYLYTQKLVHREARSLYIEQPFTQKLLHADAFTKPFYRENPLHREPVAHRLMMMMMMEMMEMEVALYDPAFQTELLSASDLHNGPSKAPPRCRPTLEVVLLGLESGASRSWMVYPGAPLQNLTWKGNIYSLRMICSMMFTDIPLFYSMFPSTIGFLIVRLECRRVMPSGKQGCQGPGFSCHEDLHRGQVRVQTSPNKSKLLALLETQYTCSNLTQADTNDEMNRFFQFCPWDGRRFFRRLSSQFQNSWEWQWNLECIGKQNQSWWLCETNV